MFYGIGSFNFTRADTKKFTLDTSNWNGLYTTYTFEGVSNVKLAYYFFALRSCPAGNIYFYTNWIDHTSDVCQNTCSGFQDRPNNDNTYNKCSACHVNCLTCNGNLNNDCLSCNATMNRVAGGGSPHTCDCMNGYVPDNAGSGWCYTCNTYITGCSTCSSSSVCTTCLDNFTPSGSSCTCSTNLIINGYCTAIIGCTMISIINNTQTCTTCNSSLLM